MTETMTDQQQQAEDAEREIERQRQLRMTRRAKQLDAVLVGALAQRRALERARRGGTPLETAGDRRYAETVLTRYIQDAGLSA